MNAQHAFRPTFTRYGCATCGRDREHPAHGSALPDLSCACGASVARAEVGSHLSRSHGIHACGLDPWRVTNESLAEVVAFAKQIGAIPRSSSTEGDGK